MTVDSPTVARIATLARIKVPEDELEHLADELNQILGWVEQLSEVDTEGVSPVSSVADLKLPQRADDVTDGAYPDRVLANAPEASDGFFTVPTVVE